MRETKAKKIYFPWSIKTDFGMEMRVDTSVEYFIFCSSQIFYGWDDCKFVIPKNVYEDAYTLLHWNRQPFLTVSTLPLI